MSKVKICIVEDECIVAQELKLKLMAFGYDVSAIVSSGEEAIEETQRSTPDLVLMDIGLQGNMDGIEAADRIHANFDIPVIYLTSYSDEATRKRADKTRHFGFLLKPFEIEDLVKIIEKALSRKYLMKE
jgi:CheY-like chemotaxis protein